MLLLCDSFSTYTDLTVKWEAAAIGASISSLAGRFDGWGLRSTSDGQQLSSKPFANSATLIAGFAFNPTYGAGGPYSGPVISFNDGASNQVELYASSSVPFGPYTYRARRAGTNLGSAGTTTHPANTWHYVEMMATIHPSAGTVIVRLDGVEIINLTGQNTRTSSNSYANRIVLHGGGGNANFYIDDLYVCDTTGSVNNSFLGDIKVVGSGPTGNGTMDYSQSVASRANSTAYAVGATILDTNSKLQRCTTAGTSAGSAPTWATTDGATTTDGSVTWTNLGTQAAYKLVSESPSDDDKSYVYSSTVNHQARFTFPAVTGGSCKAAVVYTRARKDDAGFRSIRLVAKSGSTVGDNGADIPLSSGYQNYTGIFETDPATSGAWSVAAANAAEFGVKTTV